MRQAGTWSWQAGRADAWEAPLAARHCADGALEVVGSRTEAGGAAISSRCLRLILCVILLNALTSSVQGGRKRIHI